MKKPGTHFTFNDTNFVMIIILAIVVLFIAFIKPIYQFMGKVQSGAIFEKAKNTKQVEKNKEAENNYQMLTPEGADKTICKKTVSDAGGDKTITITLYHTAGKLQSITAAYKYSGVTADYSNYIFLAQNQFKEKKSFNATNTGYSVEYKLSGSNLTANEVYLLNRASLKATGSFSETSDVMGELDDDVSSLMMRYLGEDFQCNGGTN